MGICQDCKFWLHKDGHDYGICRRADQGAAKMLAGTSCLSTLHGYEPDTYFQGSLLTQPDFGCNQFENYLDTPHPEETVEATGEARGDD